METKEQLETLKKLKTARKFLRIAATILSETADKLENEGNGEAFRYKLYANSIGIKSIADNYDTAIIEEFKTIFKMPGCQLSLEFDD